MEIMKTAAAAIITAMLYTLVKQEKPEFTAPVLISGVMITVMTCFDSFSFVSAQAGDMLALTLIDSQSISILIKALAICVITQLASNICIDNSCLSLASTLELCGKAAALAAAMPLLKSVAALAVGMIDG